MDAPIEPLIDTPMDVAFACERTVLAFTRGFDLGDAEAMARHFAPDGVWRRQDGDIAGLAQLAGFMRARHPGTFVRHVLSNLITTRLAEDRAVVDSCVTVYRRDFPGAPSLPAPMTGPQLVGRYRDELARDAHGAWRLARREVHIDFKQKDPAP